MEASGISVAVDPVDGTWALLNRMSTCSVVVAAFRGTRPFLGVVANPATGEIGYAVGDRTTRLIQVDLVGERDRAAEMPLDRAKPDSVLVNVHPSREIAPVAAARLGASANQRLTRCGKILIGMHSVPARSGTGAPGGAGGQRRARCDGSGDGRHVHSIGTVDGRFRDPR